MYLKIAGRRNATKHKIRICIALKQSFDKNSFEFQYLKNRIETMEAMLHDDTYSL